MSVILRIVVKEVEEIPFTEKYKKELVSYLDNAMRHIADIWNITIVDRENNMSF